MHDMYGVCVSLGQNICSRRVKSCVQPNTGDLLSQAVNGGKDSKDWEGAGLERVCVCFKALH